MKYNETRENSLWEEFTRGGRVFIHEECGNLKVFVDGGELTRNINR